MMPLAPRVFISYARNDGEAFAADLVNRIESADIPVWRDREGMRGGDGWWDQIDRVLDQVEFMVVAMTPGAIDSAIVRKEWDSARRKGVCLFPVIASDNLPWNQMPVWMRKGHCYDLKHQAQKFINDLNTRCQKVRVPFMVNDALPANYVPRTVVHEEVLGLLVKERIDSKAIAVALRGAGGFGKSTVARALCYDIRTRLVFYDGILWVTLGLGQKPEGLAAKVEDLIYELTKERPGFTDPAAASNRLRELLQDKNVLVVIDDVWREADAQPFLVGGAGCAWLLTTRVRDTLPESATEVSVDQMNPPEAIALLGAGLSIEDREPLNPEMSALASRLGEWPLLLSLVNRVIFDRVTRRGETLKQSMLYATTKLDRQGLVAFDRRDAGKREVAAAATIGVSLDQLELPSRDSDAADEIAAASPLARFQELVVFPEDATIPIEAVAGLWARTSGADEFIAQEICNRLFNLSLLQSYDLRTQTIRLHDVIWSFLQKRIDGQAMTRLHKELVDSYRGACGGRWAIGADDGYYFDHLIHHLIASRNLHEASALLNAEWRRAQFDRVGSDRAFAADVEAVLSAMRRETPLDVFEISRTAYICASLGTQAARVAPEALGALSRVGRPERATGYASLIHDAAQRARAYCLIAKGLVQRGEASSGLEVLAKAIESAQCVERDSPRAQALAEVAQAYALANDGAAAARAAEASVLAARESTFEYRKAADLLAAARALLSAGLRDLAVAVVDEALHAAESHSGVNAAGILVTASSVYRRAGDVVRADAVDERFSASFDELNKAAASDEYLDLGDVPELVDALVQAGELPLAQSIADAWGTSRDWNDVKSLAAVARGQLAADDQAHAEETALRLVAITDEWSRQDRDNTEKERRPNPSDWSVLVDVVYLLAELGRRDEAMRLSEKIADVDRQSAAYGVIAHVLASRAGDTAAREPLARAFAAANQRPVRSSEELHAAAAVIKASMGQRTLDQVRPIIELARRIAESIDTSDWAARSALIELAVAQAAFDTRSALALSDLLDSDNERLEMLTQIAAEMTPGRATDAARDVIGRALALLGTCSHDPEKHAQRLARLAFAASLKDDAALARKSLAELKTLALSTERTKVTSALLLGVRAWIRLRDVEAANDMAGLINNDSAWDIRHRVEAYDLLVEELLVRGDRSRAEGIAAMAVEEITAMKREPAPFRNDLVAGVVVAETLLRVGNRTKASAVAGLVLDDLSSSDND